MTPREVCSPFPSPLPFPHSYACDYLSFAWSFKPTTTTKFRQVLLWTARVRAATSSSTAAADADADVNDLLEQQVQHIPRAPGSQPSRSDFTSFNTLRLAAKAPAHQTHCTPTTAFRLESNYSQLWIAGLGEQRDQPIFKLPPHLACCLALVRTTRIAAVACLRCARVTVPRL